MTLDDRVEHRSSTTLLPPLATSPQFRLQGGTTREIDSRRRLRRRPPLPFIGTMLIVAVFHSLNLAGWPAFFDDEGTYYSQAYAVQQMGALAPYTYWYDHPPLGWIQLAAFTWLPNLVLGDAQAALLSGRIVMVGYTLVTCGLLYAVARRLGIRTWLAAAVVVLYGVNPLVLFEGRQIFLDNIALPWILGALLLAMNNRRSLWQHMAAGACFGIAVLSKETVLLLAPALLLALWQSAYRPTRAFSVTAFVAATGLTGASYLLFAMIRDELFPGPGHVSLVGALSFQFSDRPGSGFLLDSSSGGRGIVSTWLDQDPYLLFAGCLTAVLCLAVRRLRAVGLAVVLLALVALRPDGYLPSMYVIAALPFCALSIVGVADMALRGVGRIAGGNPWAVRAVAVLVVVPVLLSPVPTWAQIWQVALTADANDEQADATEYVRQNLPRDSAVVVDNTYWNDLVGSGWSTDDVLWFYKVDKDDAITEQIGGSFRGIDYIVWSPAIRDYVNSDPDSKIVRDVYDNSEIINTFGEGDSRVEVRRVVEPGDVS